MTRKAPRRLTSYPSLGFPGLLQLGRLGKLCGAFRHCCEIDASYEGSRIDKHVVIIDYTRSRIEKGSSDEE